MAEGKQTSQFPRNLIKSYNVALRPSIFLALSLFLTHLNMSELVGTSTKAGLHIPFVKLSDMTKHLTADPDALQLDRTNHRPEQGTLHQLSVRLHTIAQTCDVPIKDNVIKDLKLIDGSQSWNDDQLRIFLHGYKIGYLNNISRTITSALDELRAASDTFRGQARTMADYSNNLNSMTASLTSAANKISTQVVTQIRSTIEDSFHDHDLEDIGGIHLLKEKWPQRKWNVILASETVTRAIEAQASRLLQIGDEMEFVAEITHIMNSV